MVSLIITVSILNDILGTRFLFLPHYTNRKLQFLPVHQPLPATDIVSPTLIRFGLGPDIPKLYTSLIPTSFQPTFFCCWEKENRSVFFSLKVTRQVPCWNLTLHTVRSEKLIIACNCSIPWAARTRLQHYNYQRSHTIRPRTATWTGTPRQLPLLHFYI